ncbi:hypothetical protein AX16_006360 [Volvariella volvacea WC 439]|nr:hypothetical protein AX16_006360 [Volvariella volvacea WC 439]
MSLKRSSSVEPKRSPAVAPDGGAEVSAPITTFRLKVFKIASSNKPEVSPAAGDKKSEAKSDNKKADEKGEKKPEEKSDDKKLEQKGNDKKPEEKKNGQKTAPISVTTVEYKDITSAAFGDIRLRDVRSEIAPVINETFRFCARDGTLFQDHATLADYYGGRYADKIPLNIYIVPFKREKVASAELLDNPPFLLKFAQIMKENEIQKEGTLHSSALPGLVGGQLRLGEIREYIKTMSANQEVHQFCLDDGHVVDDAMTLKAYVSSSSKVVTNDEQSQTTPSIDVYFCKPGVTHKSKFHPASDELKKHDALKIDTAFKGGDALKAQRDKDPLKIREELDGEKYKLAKELGDGAKSASMLTEADWQIVIRNCNLMYGWVVDVDNNKMTRAPKAGKFSFITVAFRLKRGLNMEEKVQDQPAQVDSGPSNTSADGSKQVAATGAKSGNGKGSTADRPPMVPIKAPKKADAIPNFAINDNSRIEITIVTSEFQQSMAENHFNATSVEVSASGGYAGFSVGVSAGLSKESSSEQKSSTKTYEKTLVGTYRFPRATIHLTPRDLEPTDELKSTIDRVRTSKNIAELRRLHKEFGHLFCRQVVIGGCLQTKKITSATETKSEQSQKEQFKASVGVAVQTPYGGGGVKASHETGEGKQDGQSKMDAKESLVFEATGGNTILASDPPRWTASVIDFNNWRVIEQSDIGSLAETLSQIPMYSQAQQWFSQAVPLLSRYLEIPPSRTLDVRMKVCLDQLGIMRILGTEKATDSEEPLFSPRAHAPVLLSYNGNLSPEKPKTYDGNEEGKKAEAEKDKTAKLQAFTEAYRQTVWKIEVPDGEVLAHESRVSIRSLTSTPHPTMTVYRNHQGVFLPTMTSHDGPSFWRVLKADPTSAAGDSIQDGDKIRLSWRFSDQTDGFRDFFDDTFGRRRFTKPEESSDVLYLKVPYPSFESTGSSGAALVMSPAETSKPVVEALRVKPTVGHGSIDSQAAYNLHDLSFRLDAVGNNGLGESTDYMAPTTDPKSQPPSYVWGVDRGELKEPVQILAKMLLSDVKSPIAGPLLRAVLL